VTQLLNLVYVVISWFQSFAFKWVKLCTAYGPAAMMEGKTDEAEERRKEKLKRFPPGSPMIPFVDMLNNPDAPLFPVGRRKLECCVCVCVVLLQTFSATRCSMETE
jgi:hypothetical protein